MFQFNNRFQPTHHREMTERRARDLRRTKDGKNKFSKRGTANHGTNI